MPSTLIITPLNRQIRRSLGRQLQHGPIPLRPFQQSQWSYFSSKNRKPKITDINQDAEKPIIENWDGEVDAMIEKGEDSDDSDGEKLTDQKRLDVAIVGFPNAGKSQLLNALVGTKVAAVSRKRHTTRDGILGVSTHGKAQLCFMDTPGFMTSPNDQIGRDLVMTAKSHMANVDFSLVVIDAAKTKLEDDYMNTVTTLMWNALHAKGGKFGLVLNKVDLVKPKKKLLEQAQLFGRMADVMILEKNKLQAKDNPPDFNLAAAEDLLPEIFYTSAKQGNNDRGVQDVLKYLLDRAVPNREWMLPEAHMVSPLDFPARVEEIIREKIYRTLHREVPHQIMQRNRQMELVRGVDNASSVMVIDQDLLVRTKSHLKLLQTLVQRLHDAAIPELRELFECEVMLTLNPKLISRNRR